MYSLVHHHIHDSLSQHKRRLDLGPAQTTSPFSGLACAPDSLVLGYAIFSGRGFIFTAPIAVSEF